MIVLVSLIVLLRGFPCFHDFSHGASLHPYSTLVPHIFRGSRINAAIRSLETRPPPSVPQLHAPTIKCVGGKTEGEGLDTEAHRGHPLQL